MPSEMNPQNASLGKGGNVECQMGCSIAVLDMYSLVEYTGDSAPRNDRLRVGIRFWTPKSDDSLVFEY